MADTLYGFTADQVKRILAVVRRVNLDPRGTIAGPSTYRGPQYNVAEFKLQASLSDSDTDGVDAKFWYDATQGDTVKVFPFGLHGTVPNAAIVVAYWWGGKWKYLASAECPV